MTKKISIFILLLFLISIFSIGVQAMEEEEVPETQSLVEEQPPEETESTVEEPTSDTLVIEAESVAIISDGVGEVDTFVEIVQTEEGITEVSAHTTAKATADWMHLISRIYAQGKRVKGGGEATLITQSHEEGYVGVQIITNAMENGMYSVEVISEVIGSGIGETFAWVWADNIDENSVQTISQVSSSNDYISGYVFGHSDAERYWHFKKQAILNCYDGVDESGFKTCQRAVYNMEILIDDNSKNQTVFESKYNLTETVRIRDLLINLSRN